MLPKYLLKLSLYIGILCNAQNISGQENFTDPFLIWEQLNSLPPVGDQKSALGIAGAITGIHNEVILVAGGANFDTPIWQTEKVWHEDIWALTKDKNGNHDWRYAGNLDHPVAYSSVVSCSLGIIAMGGSNKHEVFDEVLLLQWDSQNQSIHSEYLPKLPTPNTNGSAAILNNIIYLAGGSSTHDLSSATNDFWRLDLDMYGTNDFQWEVLPSWPGPNRAFNITVAQHNGQSNNIYLISGRRQNDIDGRIEFLDDNYEFNSDRFDSGLPPYWRKRKNIPSPRASGTGIGVGQGHIFILSGADGSLYEQADKLKENHPGFPTKLLGYHTITDTWFDAGNMPANHVTTHAFLDNESIIIASGEIKPRTRSPLIWSIDAVRKSPSIGWINMVTIGIYLVLLIGVGVFFSFRNQSTDDFFRAGQRIPWWAAGCSIFATMLSSITFMAIPAKSYATDWLYFFLNMTIIALAPFVVIFILPFFRRINATSAYEYLELRFNIFLRIFASTSYILFQLGRMAIVMYLPSLALSAILPISIVTSILIMGTLSIIYSALGGLEAVIWTDTIQTFVLLSGALLSLILIIANNDIGMSQFINTAMQDNKFRLAEWNWDYTGNALWIIILGGLGQNIIPYSSDQGVIQRYMSVSDEKKAAQSIWANAGLTFFASILFFALGTALYVFYKLHPTEADPTFQTDAVFPLFIVNQLPVGITGLVIAGIIAAAQSTISTSMNSMATALTTDFARRFAWLQSEKSFLNLARFSTVLFGLLGTLFALLIASADVKSLWDSFIGIMGLFGGAMCGLFLLGIFTEKANSKGALVGALVGVLCLWITQAYTDVSFLLYGAIGIFSTFAVGWIFSLIFIKDKKDLKGLTIYTQ